MAEREADLANAQSSAAQAHQRLEEADSWVFKLAKERQAAEATAASLRRKLSQATAQATRHEVEMARIEAQLAKAGAENSFLKAELESLSKQAAEVREELRSSQQEWEISSQSDRMRIVQQQAELSAITKMLLETEQALSALQAERENLQAAYEAEVESRQAEEAKLAHQIKRLQEMSPVSPEAGEGHRQASRNETRLAELVRESTLMTQLLGTAEDAAAAATEHRAWLKEVNVWLVRRPRWWSLLPAEMRRQREWASLQTQGIFDPAAYLELYPDVASAGVNPLHHYITHGMAEGRKLTR